MLDLVTKVKGIAELPTHTIIHHLKSIKLCALLDNRLWEPCKNFKTSSYTKLVIGAEEIPLERSCSLDDLHKYYIRSQKHKIDAAVNLLRSKQLVKSRQRETEYYTNLSQEVILNEIFEKILPLHTSRVHNQTTKRLLSWSTNLTKLLHTLQSNQTTQLPTPLTNNTILVWQNRVYSLNSQHNPANFQIKYGEQHLEISTSSANLNQLERRVQSELSSSIKLQTKYDDKLATQKSRLLLELKENGFCEKDNLGVFSKGDDYYIYLRIPNFSIRTTHQCTSEKYYFNSCRVATKIRIRHGTIQQSHPQIVEHYSHPFLSERNKSFQNICMGTNKIPDSIAIPHEKAYANLVLAANNIVHGYLEGATPYKDLSPDNFPNNYVN
ncbi:hypothetical protein HN419_06080 [Candidatus Woesearchaeota archaeon]|jgi:hypothetical protein|nr:hypothetical protein [Candidatus Woesearchaeota archaeon]MBT3537561.1 hypothetical protein [Candidatus Woesearchaeota archaeon]MBT4698379.1 hypothetical protein [Candidatus Woesearchaeota archaeon]MBT4716536.1 hypothetical protein [Candidatus Woesearchaeota archaeon]MBT7105230.1 hypothetical protein [Candidatus Woesearchaeota archaeon]